MDDETIRSLHRRCDAGRKAVRVTGRTMAELRHVITDLSIFDRVVLENRGVVSDPATRRHFTILALPPEPALISAPRSTEQDD